MTAMTEVPGLLRLGRMHLRLMVTSLHEAFVVHRLTSQAVMNVQHDSRVFVAFLPPVGQGGQAPGISGEECDALSANDGIVASGGFQQVSGSTGTVQYPTAGLQLSAVTPGFLRVIGAQPLAAGAELVGPDAAEELGLRDGARLMLSGASAVPVVVLVRHGARTDAVGRAVVQVRLARLVQGSCYVEFASDVDAATASRLIAALVPGAVVQRLTSADSMDDVARRYDTASFHAWVFPASLIALLPWVISLAARKSELTLYSLMSRSRLVVASILGFEWLVSLTVVAAAVTLALALVAQGDQTAAKSGIAIIMVDIGILWFAAVAVALWATRMVGGEFELLRSSR